MPATPDAHETVKHTFLKISRYIRTSLYRILFEVHTYIIGHCNPLVRITT